MDMSALFSMRSGIQNKPKEEKKEQIKDAIADTVNFLKTETEA
jgi:hypothetical protein